MDTLKVDTDAFNEFDRLAEKIEGHGRQSQRHARNERSEVGYEIRRTRSARRVWMDELMTLKLEMGMINDPNRQIEDKSKSKSKGVGEPEDEDDDD